jgi:hypothetical protein
MCKLAETFAVSERPVSEAVRTSGRIGSMATTLKLQYHRANLETIARPAFQAQSSARSKRSDGADAVRGSIAQQNGLGRLNRPDIISYQHSPWISQNVRRETRSKRSFNGYLVSSVISGGRDVEYLQDRSHGDEDRVVGHVTTWTNTGRDVRTIFRSEEPEVAPSSKSPRRGRILDSGFQKTFGLEFFGLVLLCVMKHCPRNACRVRMILYPHTRHTPYVSNNHTAPRYEVVSIYVVLDQSMGETEWHDRMSSENFLAEGIDVGQAFAILEDGSRSIPITESSSACAFRCTSG